VFTTKDSLNEILLETEAIVLDADGDMLLILYDGSVWLAVPAADHEQFYLSEQRFHQC
jgi:hypothetical protein